MVDLEFKNNQDVIRFHLTSRQCLRYTKLEYPLRVTETLHLKPLYSISNTYLKKFWETFRSSLNTAN